MDDNEGTISESYATGNVDDGGGLVAGDQNGGTISNSYATGAVAGNGSGGLVQNDVHSTLASISYSYSTGAVSSGSGGFICGPSGASLADDYWDTTTSGTSYGECDDLNITGVTGLTTQQLQSGLPTGFDPKIWAEDSGINNGLPYLINNPPVKK